MKPTGPPAAAPITAPVPTPMASSFDDWVAAAAGEVTTRVAMKAMMIAEIVLRI
jgi:hypothetical protein